MKRFLIVFLSVWLVGCTSIPFSTMLKFNSMDKEDLINLQPELVRAKTQVDEPIEFDTDKTEMAVEIETPDGLVPYSFPLKLLAEKKLPKKEGFFSDIPAKNEYLFALSEEAIENFKRFQSSLDTEEQIAVSFSIKSGFKTPPQAVDKITLSVFLKLTEEQGFITMFDNATIKIKREDE